MPPAPAPSAAIYLTCSSLAVLFLGLATIFLARRYRRRRICAARIKQKEASSPSPSFPLPPPSFPLPPQVQRPINPPTVQHPTKSPPLQHHSPPMYQHQRHHKHPQPQPKPKPPSTVTQQPPRAAYLAPSGDPWTPLPPPECPLPLPPPALHARVSVSVPVPPLFSNVPARRHIIMAAEVAAVSKRGDIDGG